MAETTGIAWTDATFNPWIGCTKVGPGCDHCYAEALDKRHRWHGVTHWGAGVPRMRTSAANWRKPLTWQRHAENGLLPDGKTSSGGRSPRVFCASLADVFDNEVPDEWHADLWGLIESAPSLTWQLVTKRAGNVLRMVPPNWLIDYWPRNVWIGATIVNQEEADRDVPKLLEVPAAVRFVSYEPALGPVDWTKFPGINWIIVGGESGGSARQFDLAWAYSTIAQCRTIGATPFIKQLGRRPIRSKWPPEGVTHIKRIGWQNVTRWKDSAGADPAEWPEDLRVQEFPA